METLPHLLRKTSNNQEERLKVKEFIEFPKLARLSRECVITEKLDGTNASICITEEGEFLIGSRTRWITPQQDNYGFAKWVTEHKEWLLTLGIGHHFGEWWGNGCQRGYGLQKGDKRFSLFNTIRWVEHNQTPKLLHIHKEKGEVFQGVLPACVSLVPVIYTGLFTTDACEQALEQLKLSGSIAVPGFMKPEGIVCFHVAGNCGFKKTIENDETPKSLIIQ